MIHRADTDWYGFACDYMRRDLPSEELPVIDQAKEVLERHGWIDRRAPLVWAADRLRECNLGLGDSLDY